MKHKYDNNEVWHYLQTDWLRNWLSDPEYSGSADASLVQKMNTYVEVVLTVHNASIDIFFDDDEDFGDKFNRYMFYAIRHEDYFDEMNFGEFVIYFYMRVAEWHAEKDPKVKAQLYAQLVVDAYRIRARTSAFFRELWRVNGKIWFTNQQLRDH